MAHLFSRTRSRHIELIAVAALASSTRKHSALQDVRRGLTSWRSAANAPDEYQDVMTIDGAFVCCNGMLDRPLHRSAKHPGNPGASFCRLAQAHRAGAWRSSRRINRDLVANRARRGQARARSDHHEESTAILLPCRARTLAHPAPRTEPPRLELKPPHSTRRELPSITSFVDVRGAA